MTIRNLVFEGGGVKGIAYVGALQVLEARGLLGSVENVAGTSAGAITAALVAVGATSEEIQSILGSTDFASFMDGGWGVIGDAKRLFEEYGIYKGDAVEKWCRERIGEITQRATGQARPDITFAQLAQWAHLEPGRFRKLFVVTTNLTSQMPEVFSARTRPNVPVWQAVRMSMSIPLFYEAVKFEQGLYVDGAVSWNYPIDLFDGVTRRPVIGRPEVAAEVGTCSETLGFYLGTPREIEAAHHGWRPLPVTISGLKSYAQALFSFMVDTANRMHMDEVALGRTVFIDNAGVGTTDFTLTDAQKQQLVDNGVQATSEWLQRDAAQAGAPRVAAG